MNTIQSNDTIRWGIIGCGDVTEIKSGPAFNKVPYSRLVAVMRRDGTKAADYARRHRVSAWYDDAQALINDPQVDAVYIATPPDSHAPYALQVAQAGKPAYVEKPMALHYGQCQQMVEAFEKRNVPLFVAYYRRCLPLFLKARDLVAEGALGNVRAVSIRLIQPVKPNDHTQPWRVQPEKAGGGHFFDLASHQLDFLDYMLGPIQTASGLKTNQAGLYPAEDIVSGCFRFQSGVQGVGLWCFTAAPSVAKDTIEIIGDKGKLGFSSFDLSQPLVFTGEEGRKQWEFTNPAHVQQPLIQTVVDALRGVGACPSTGRTAARTSWVMDQLTGNSTPA